MSKLSNKIRLMPIIKHIRKTNALCKKIDRNVKDNLDYYIMSAFNGNKMGISDDKRDRELMVSITTYGARIHTVHIVIESLMLQTVKADKIVLWLTQDEFTCDQIPEILKWQEKRGLTIRYCRDIKSYKKLIPAITECPNDLIITADDDIVYPIDHIERLYKAYLKEPEIIHCCRAHLIKYNSDNCILPYKEWELETQYPKESTKIFPTGGAGALYYPGCFDADIIREEIFMKYCPFADDIWFKYMSYRTGVKCKIIPNSLKLEDCKQINLHQHNSLWSINQTKNDQQLKNLLQYYNDNIEPEVSLGNNA